MTLEEKLTIILNQSKEISKKYLDLKSTYESALDDKYLIKNELENQIKINEDLLNQIKLLKLARDIKSEDGGNTQSVELKSRIQEFVKEIDKCIALLNS